MRTSHQELTLSYMCDHGKGKEMGTTSTPAMAPVDDHPRPTSPSRAADHPHPHPRWLERDFLRLGAIGDPNGGEAASESAAAKKRTREEMTMSEEEDGGRGKGEEDYYEDGSGGLEKKKTRTRENTETETVGLSSTGPITTTLALSLHSTKQDELIPSSDPPSTNPSCPAPPLATASRRAATMTQKSNGNTTHCASSDDEFSLSRSFFSHNPSCSLTGRNYSTEYFEETDSIWHHNAAAGGGDGTNGSVHSTFRPIGDGTNTSITLSNLPPPRAPDNRGRNPSSDRSIFHGAVVVDNNSYSFFPSLLPARSATATSMRPEHVLDEIISEPVPVFAQKLNELPSDAIETTKDYLRSLIVEPGKREEFTKLQSRLERRSDLTSEVLRKSNEKQLDILIATRTGVADFLDGKIRRRPTRELIEIFLHLRCRNAMCNSVLPVEDCDCKICSTTKGFCGACMCPVCMKFDCVQSTCTWVGCDVCSHWCHALCGIQKNLIRPGPSLKGAAGTTEVLFYCLGCGHASEMFGFAKDVFLFCAKDWGLETLKKELSCIVNIFQVSDDLKGKQLRSMTEKVVTLLERELISPGDACDAMLQFFKYGKSELSIHTTFRDDSATAALASMPSKAMCTNASPMSDTKEALNRKLPCLGEASQGTASLSRLPRMEGFENLESTVKFKQAEAALFQRLADDARREVEVYCQIIRMQKQKLEEEYASKLTKLCLKEAGEQRSRKQEELRLLEESYRDYYKMKMRMEAEMEGLLERMEMTMQHLVQL